MRRYYILMALFLLLGGFGMIMHPRPYRIANEERACTADSDCTVIAVGCRCCGGAGIDDAVNRAHAERLKFLSVCTAGEAQRCATRNCVDTTTATAVCRRHSCTVTVVPLKTK